MANSERTMVELIREYEGSDAYRFENLVQSFDESWSLVEANAAELNGDLRRIADPASAHLWHVDRYGDRPALRAALVEVVRRLHNFLSAGVAMIDYTRPTVALYRDRVPAFPVEHRARYKVLRQSDEYGFVTFLRNWALHIHRHEIVATAEFAGARVPAVYLNADSLRRGCSDGRHWAEEGAARFLARVGDEFDVAAIPKLYLDTVRDFLNWFRQQQGEAHQLAAGEVRTLLAEMDRWGPRGT